MSEDEDDDVVVLCVVEGKIVIVSFFSSGREINGMRVSTSLERGYCFFSLHFRIPFYYFNIKL